MLTTTHLMVGATLSTIFPNPLISFPLAFLSHFVIDLIPHWNWKPNTLFKQFAAIVEGLFGLILVFILLKNSDQPLIVLFASLIATIPDALQGPYYLWGSKNVVVRKMTQFQRSHQGDLALPWGLIIQVAIVIGLFMVINSYQKGII